MLCAVSGAPTSGRLLTTLPVLAPFPSLSHRHPLLPGPDLTSLINGSNQNPSLCVCFWENTSQATSFYEARVFEHRDAHGRLSHFPRQEIPVYTASRKPNRLERTGLKLDATRAPRQGHGAPTPHPRPSPFQEKVRKAEGGQSTVGRARCPLHAHQGGKAGLEAGWACWSEMPQLMRAQALGVQKGGRRGRQLGYPRAGVINLPSAEIPHQRLRRIPAAGWARRTCLLTTGPHLCLLIGGEARALLPLGQGQGMKAHSPPCLRPHPDPCCSQGQFRPQHRTRKLAPSSFQFAMWLLGRQAPATSARWRSGPAHTCLSPGPPRQAPNSQSLSCLHEAISGNSV